MSVADVVASFMNALIGATVVTIVVLAERVVTRRWRRRGFTNRRFMRLYRAGRRRARAPEPVPSSRRLAVQLPERKAQ